MIVSDLTTHSKIALLAPVPEEHLVSGLAKCRAEGKVAFGSRLWELFRDLDDARDGLAVEAYLYASRSQKLGPPKVRWHGIYIGHVEVRGGAHPDGAKYIPESANSDRRDHWAVFWEVTGLSQLEKSECVPMNHFVGLKTRAKYKSSFVPERPLLVEAL